MNAVAPPPTLPGASSRLGAELRTVPAVVWALCALQLALMLGYSVLMPVYRAPDEPQNFDIAVAAASLTEFPGRHRVISPMVRRSYPYAAFDMDDRRLPVPAEPPAARGERPSFADLLQWPGPTPRARNQQWQHPPLYPATLGAALTVTTALVPPAYDLAFDQTVGLARALTALLVAPLPALVFLTARRLGVDPTATLAAAALPLAIPQLTHIGAAVSHDTLLILVVGVATVVVAFVLRGDASIRTALLLGVTGGLALLTKGFGLFVPAWIGVVYLAGAWRRRRWSMLLPGVLAVATTAALGGWWWMRNLVVHGAVQPTGVRLPEPPVTFEPDAAAWVWWAAIAIVRRFWGQLGWYQARLPGGLIALAALVLAAAVVIAFVRRRDGGPSRTELVVLSLPTCAILGIVAYGGWGYYVATGRALGLQGRYLFPALTGLAVVAAAGVSTLPLRARRWAPGGVLFAAGVLHAAAVLAVLRGVYGAGWVVPWREAAAAVLAWSPWPAGALVAYVVLLAGTVAAVAVTLRAELRRTSPPPGRVTPTSGDRLCAAR